MSVEPLVPAVEAVLGADSIESDRDRYPWREIHGRLGEVLAGGLDARFAWPPATEDDVRGFERSMAAGSGPIIESLAAARGEIFGARTRWLDVVVGDFLAGPLPAGYAPAPAVSARRSGTPKRSPRSASRMSG